MMGLVDGDIIVYRAAFAAERKRYIGYGKVADEEGGLAVEPVPFWDDYDYHAMMRKAKEMGYDGVESEAIVELEPVENALNNANEMIEAMKEKTGVTDIEVYLSTGEESFRHKAATMLPYKGNRKAPKPVHYEAVRQHLIDVWGALVFKSVEADDILAIMQKYTPDDTVICSVDKDLLTIPGKHYHFVNKEMFTVSEEEALRNWYMQMLMGDTTDNIPGIKGMGPVKAAKLIDNTPPEEWWDMLVDAWTAHVGNRDKALEVIDEVRILITIGDDDAIQAIDESGEAATLRPIQVPA